MGSRPVLLSKLQPMDKEQQWEPAECGRISMVESAVVARPMSVQFRPATPIAREVLKAGRGFCKAEVAGSIPAAGSKPR